MLLSAVALAACLPVGSALAVFTKQTTVPANTLSAAASFPMCYRDAVLADNPVSYWRLDETSGTTAVDSTGGRNGTYTGGGFTLNQAGALPDTVNNKGAGFDGTAGYVAVPYAAALNPSTFTVEVWAKPTGGLGTYRIAASSWTVGGGGDYQGYWVGIYPNDRWTVHMGDGVSGILMLDGPTPVLNAWTHLVATYDGAALKLYINGTLVNSTATTQYSPNTSPTEFDISGEYSNGSRGNWFLGSLDEVAVYNSALTAAKIRTHYNAGRCYKDGVLADSPTGYWRLGEAAGGTAVDAIRSRYGSYVGGPTLAQTGALTGDANTAVTLNGTSQYASVPYDSGLNPGQVTLEAWAKPTGGAGTARTVLAAQDTNKGYLLGIGTDDKWRFTIGTGAATTVVTGSTVTLNAWAHLAATYNGTTATLYVNGLSAGTASVTVSVNTTRPLGIGATDAGGTWAGYFPGTLDEAALYASALTSTRVQAHYLLGRSYKDTVLDSAPVSYWRLGEAAGTSAADSKGPNTGTYTNGPTLAQPGALAGDTDTSVGFSGAADVVTVPDAAALRPAQLSVEAWIEPDPAMTYWGTVLMKSTNWNWTDGYGVWWGSGQLRFWVNDYTAAEVLTTIPTGQWTHAVGTYDGTTVRLYLNGVEVANRAYSTPITQSTNRLFIGEAPDSAGNPDPNADWKGGIDDVAVYNRALSAAEVQVHYDSGRQ